MCCIYIQVCYACDIQPWAKWYKKFRISGLKIQTGTLMANVIQCLRIKYLTVYAILTNILLFVCLFILRNLNFVYRFMQCPACMWRINVWSIMFIFHNMHIKNNNRRNFIIIHDVPYLYIFIKFSKKRVKKMEKKKR